MHHRLALGLAFLAAALIGVAVGRLTAPHAAAVAGARTTFLAAGVDEASEPARRTPAKITGAVLPAFMAEWEELRRQPASAPRDAAAAAWLTRYAARSPEQALALVLAEPHRARRRAWRDAVLRGWAVRESDAASAWLLRQPPDEERTPDIAALLAGAAEGSAEAAVALARQFAVAFPAGAGEHGALLIAALADMGQFTAAAEFALGSVGDPERRDAWIARAFACWSEHQPQTAVTAAGALPDPALRDVAWRAAVANWAQNEPATLADYAVRLPAGEARSYALGEALRLWIDRDVPQAASWLDRLEPSRETDLAVSLIATHPALTQYRPDVALSWAESISEPTARSRTVARVVKAWADSDPISAARYARASAALLPADREDTLPGERFTPHP